MRTELFRNRTELLECVLSSAMSLSLSKCVRRASTSSTRIYFDKLNPHYRGCVAARSAVQSPTPSSARMIA